MKATQSKPERLPPQIIGNIGLFHVCHQLSRRGLNAVPTSRNTKSVDVIVGSVDFSHHATIQIKTSTIDMGTIIVSRKNAKSKNAAMQIARLADFWVFVRLERENCHEVRAVAMCKGDDGDLLVPSRTHWWFDPWRSPRYPTKVSKKWNKQKNEDGWRLITKCLSKGR